MEFILWQWRNHCNILRGENHETTLPQIILRQHRWTGENGGNDQKLLQSTVLGMMDVGCGNAGSSERSDSKEVLEMDSIGFGGQLDGTAELVVSSSTAKHLSTQSVESDSPGFQFALLPLNSCGHFKLLNYVEPIFYSIK